jgi:hypothetical protein
MFHPAWLATKSSNLLFDGIGAGQTTISQLQKLVDDLNNPSSVNWKKIFYWYYVMQKFHVNPKPDNH